MSPKTRKISRRAFVAASAAAAVAKTGAASARVMAGENSDYVYEVSRTPAEWEAMLTPNEYVVMREGYTEQPKSSPHWEETRPGTYQCRGCDLPVFDGRWKEVLDKGWVFFDHSIPDSTLTNIDGPTPEYGSMAEGQTALMEVHCRRCGSHLGHYLRVAGKNRHCINGTSLTFAPDSA
jgi:peptide-methionine (R)-S-oxide reductase